MWLSRQIQVWYIHFAATVVRLRVQGAATKRGACTDLIAEVIWSAVRPLINQVGE